MSVPPSVHSFRYTTYDLVANIVHDGPPTPGSGTHRIHLLHRGTGKWFEMQDLHVTEILPQMIPLSETLVQVFYGSCVVCQFLLPFLNSFDVFPGAVLVVCIPNCV